MAWLQEGWPILLTILLPFIVAGIAKMSWSSAQKAWMATGLSVVVGVLAVLNSGLKLTPQNLLLIATAVRGGMQIAYDLFRRAGITSAWLDWLLTIGSDYPVEATPVTQNWLPTTEATYPPDDLS